jgi:hypothetical protein
VGENRLTLSNLHIVLWKKYLVDCRINRGKCLSGVFYIFCNCKFFVVFLSVEIDYFFLFFLLPYFSVFLNVNKTIYNYMSITNIYIYHETLYRKQVCYYGEE